MKCKALTSIISIVFIGTLAFHFIVLAAIDAPHNESSNINCGSCHGQGLLNSPFWGGSMSYDQLCLNCHTASSGPYTETNAPLVKTHSSENTSENYGVWSWECRNCHDAHYQKQKNYKNTDAGDLYLATGIIDSCAYNAVDNKSTLTYTSINYKAGWDATRLLEKTSEYRRAILFPNVNKLGYSYPVVAIDTPLAGTIVVLGDARPVYQYITESTFAMMYGQYVKDNINDNQVKFLDQTGINSYVDGDTTYNGVCEVCHTVTAYHRNDSSGDHTHYASETCRTCHPHLNGFGHGGATPGGDCIECHGHDAGYEYETGKYSQGKGTYTSHSTHTENDSDDLKGPYVGGCSSCHDINNYPFFNSGIDSNSDGRYDLSETDVCDTCHSPNGAFDGVNDVVIGAKNNWTDGVYASPTLKTGKEQWCAGCHDDDPANSKKDGTGVGAPKVIGDNSTYGFYATGHGVNEMVGCLDCHDTSKKHIDHEHRTYEVDEGPDPDVIVNPYSASYRLRDINGQPALNVPLSLDASSPPVIDRTEDYALCFDCHGALNLLSDPTDPIGLTNFYGTSCDSYTCNGGSGHTTHLGIYQNYTDSDWDGIGDAPVSCITCHNVHGAPNNAMIRHGELISTPGTTDKVPALNFFYLTVSPYPTATATWTFNVALDGTYSVYAWWCARDNRATDAPYTIYYNGGSETVRVNQEINGSQWNLLGNFPFVASTAGSVMLGNDANEFVIADAIKIEGAGPGGTDIIIDEELATFTGTWTDGNWSLEHYNEDSRYTFKALVLDTYATLEETVGGRMGVMFSPPNSVCFGCHYNPISYYRTPYLGPRVIKAKVTPDRVINDGTGTTLITALAWDTTGDFSTMEVDLTPIGGSTSQQMYDDGTNGDVTPGDGAYSYLATVAASTDDEPKSLVITATDSTANEGQSPVSLMVVNEDDLESIYMNNTDAAFVCTWTCGSDIPEAFMDDNCYRSAGTGSCTTIWTPDIPAAGTYKVYAWWCARDNRATDAPYTIYYDGGSETIRVNQEINGSQWNLLGTYNFAAGTSGYVVLSNDANEYVIADAIKFQPQP